MVYDILAFCNMHHIYNQVKPVADDEMFKVLRSGKRKNKAWKRMVTKVR